MPRLKHTTTKQREILNFIKSYRLSYSRYPRVSEVVKGTGFSLGVVRRSLDRLREDGMLDGNKMGKIRVSEKGWMVKQRALTPKQKKCLRFIQCYTRRYKHPPKLSEIATELQVSNASAARKMLLTLERKGFIERERYAHRSITVKKAVK